MVETVALSDEAFEALDDERREGESDSDVVLRIVREARAARKDPVHFVRTRDERERLWSPEEHLEFLERMDEADREKARKQWEEREDGD